MFNLIPDNLKDKIKSEYKSRRIVVILGLIILMEVILIVLISPSWVISFYKEKELKNIIDQNQKSVLSDEANNVLEIIDSTNKKLVVLSNFMEYPEVIPVYENIISQKPSGIKINEFSYSSATSTATIDIKGVSSTRDILVYFVKKLGESDFFDKIDSPVSNLAKQKNIDFTITLKVSK